MRSAVPGHRRGPPLKQAHEHALLAVLDHVVRPEDRGERHHRGREAVIPVGAGQVLLAHDLVAPVLDLVLREIDGMGLADREDLRVGVDRRRAGEDVVAGPPVEDLVHAAHVVDGVGAHVLDAVELFAGEDLAHALVVRAVAVEAAHAGRQHGLRDAAVEGRDLVAVFHELLDEMKSVEPCAAHHQDPHEEPPHHAHHRRAHSTPRSGADAGL